VIVTNFAIYYFQLASRAPVSDFIENQDENAQAKIKKCFNIIQIYGSRAGRPFVKKIDKELYELRIRGSNEIRFIFACSGKTVLMLHGFKKKSQKLPLKELRLARKRLTIISHI
jgi:phage-related protein